MYLHLINLESIFQDLRKYEGSMKDLKKLYEFGRSKIIKLRELIDDLQTYASEQTEEPSKKRYLNVVRNEKDQLNRFLH